MVFYCQEVTIFAKIEESFLIGGMPPNQVDELRRDVKENYATKAEVEKNFVSWRTFVWFFSLAGGVLTIVSSALFGALGLIYAKQEAMVTIQTAQTASISSLSTAQDNQTKNISDIKNTINSWDKQINE